MSLLKPTRGIQLNKSHPLARGLVFFPPFNEGTGNTVFDLSGDGNTGVFAGDPQWVAGKFGSAVDFDGTGDLILIINPAALRNPSAFSVSFWANSDIGYVAIDFAFTISDGITAGTLFGIYPYDTLGGNGVKVYWGGDLINENSATRTGWNHFLFVSRSATDHEMYVNGISVGVSAESKVIGDWSNLRIGAWYGGQQHFNGQIDLPMAYNRALSVFEIAWLYRKPFCMFAEDNIARISSIVAPEFVEIAGSLAALSFLTDSAALKRARGIAGGVTAQSSLAGLIKVSKKISGAITATSSLSGSLSLVGEVSRSRGRGFKPIEGAERLRGLRRSAFY